MNFRRGKFVCTALLVVTFAGLGARVLWHAATTKTGWQVLEEQARWATLGWFIEPEPIVQRLPPEQAEFWLERTEEVLAKYPDDAEIIMGAALMLHHPDSRYMAKLVTFPQWPGGGMSQPEIDNDRAKNLEQEFEGLCRERSLELAELATRLEPDNLAWWRLRGYLVLPPYNQQDYFTSRLSDWEDILRGCAEHDPDNAFYDYLAASIHWEAGGTLVPVGIPDLVVDVEDPERLAAGNAAFERGQAKPLLVIGREGYHAVAKFVDQANLSSTELPVTMKGSLPGIREMHVAETELLRNLHRWQYARSITAAGEGDVSASFERYREMRRVLEQHAKGDTSSESDNFHLFSARAMATALLELAIDNPGLVDGKQLRQPRKLLGR